MVDLRSSFWNCPLPCLGRIKSLGGREVLGARRESLEFWRVQEYELLFEDEKFLTGEGCNDP